MHTSAPKSKTETPSAQERKTASLNGISDNRPEAQQLASLSGIAAGSAQVAQLQAFQQMANAYTQTNQYVPGLKKQDAGEGVVQGVFVYSAEHTAIEAVNESPAQSEERGLHRYASADGNHVWATETDRAAAEAASVTEEVKAAQDQIARAKLRAGNANVYEHEIRDENAGFQFRQEGVSYPDVFIIQPLGTGKTEALFSTETIFCSENGEVESPGWIKEVTQDDVYAFWETPRDEDNEEMPPQGSYGEAEGYERVAGTQPDDRFNCAAYAQGDDTVWIEPEAMHEQLADAEQYEKLESDANMEIGVNYIVAKANHFWRAKKTGADRYEISEKNGPSAIYKRTMTAEQWAATMDGSIRGIYRKK